ncbi:amino acid ABC transporter permease [Rhizobium sp. BK602]|uniref:amino acid ABC transporter permease n=1 Tax=Rhizobium sp. BK602 TaxID=2586986 RepID=UPI0016106DCD|nr:amino acid ABC transporter permease [Rhizobium sp. BK602]MBB3610871.1 general L-amino acid transport system permease protein [Rhizobium sp. BK602]
MNASSPAITASRPVDGLWSRIRKRYFKTPLNVIISLVGAAFLLTIAYHVLGWAVVKAVWISPDGTSQVCRNIEGACWAVIQQRWRIIIFGLFPYDEQWRSSLACFVMVATMFLSCVPWFWKPLRLSILWCGGFTVFYLLMRGGFLGMSEVQPAQWGGLTLTVFLYAAGVLIGMPMAISLALLRRSELPLIARASGILIDSVRSLPLVSILFTAALVFPFLLPDWLQGDKIWRVIIGFALFFAAYQAEILRSGIQSLPGGQEEAAKALGLTYWQRTSRIILPQAFRRALPPTINQLVITFKETSLIVIIGFFEILASGHAAYGTGEWAFAYFEVYVFVGLIYFIFVFSLSRYGAYLERRLNFGPH